MTEKVRTSVSLDQDVHAYLQQDHINASAYINQLVQNDMAGGDSESALVELRIQQVESELEERQSSIETKKKELEMLRSRREEHQSAAENVLDEAEGVFDPHMLEPDNPAVENWAQKAGMTNSQFIQEMERRLDDG